MKKLSKITESIWADLEDRSSGDVSRREDYEYTNIFKKIKTMELIHPSVEWVLGVDYLWTPCNFGAESYDQPGLYLNSEELVELHEFLKNTEYEIAGSMAFDILRNRRFEKKKIGKTWYYIFGGDDDKKLYIPNFGVYTEGSDNLIKPTGNDAAYYGCYHIEGAGYTQIKNAGKSYLCKTYINSSQGTDSDRFQVRLVKKI